ncbi:MAG: hypothetical protein Q8L48_30405 [Archangium sp.]|nr:hypothetical protein [Archangium sp.]
MNFARTVVALSLLLFPLEVLAAPDARVADAQKRLDTARSSLTAAVQRIEKDPPSNPDLDAALAAVEALKTAIDAGAEAEANDLDYARAVLAARKELRTQREYVEQRRSKVHVFDSRRVLDAALATLTEKATRAEGKDATAKDFDDDRAAIAALRKLVDDAKPLGKEDPKFAAYLTELTATLARREKALDDRTLAQLVAGQRPLLEEARKAFSTALAALSPAATDAQFKDADTAASALAKRLDDGKALEAKDAAYRGDATKIRAELTQGKKKADDLWSATGLARLKAEIEPARKDLATTARGVRARKPTPDQLAEARTAAIVVRKLIEKFEPEAARSQAFAQYVIEVKGLLFEVEAGLHRRNLEAVSNDVNQALKAIAKKDAPDEAFAEANSALGVLEKTIATMDAKNPTLAPYLFDANKLLREGRASTAQRRTEVDADGQRKKLAEASKDVNQALKAISKKDATDENFAEANSALGILEKTIAAMDAKNPLLAAYVGDANKLLREGRASAGQRRTEVDADAQKKKLAQASKDVNQALKTIARKDVTDENFAEANSALGVLEKTIAATDAKNAMLGPFVFDAKALLRDGKASTKQRRNEVDADLQRKQLAEASKDVNQGLKSIAKNNPPDDAFAEANSAIGILEKTIAAMDAKNALLAAYVNDAKALLRDAKASTNKRRIEVDVERQRVKVEAGRQTLTTLYDALSKPGFTQAQVDAAEGGIKDLLATLDASAELTKKDRQYGAYDREVRKRVAELTKKMGGRKVVLAAANARAALVEAVASTKAKVDAARQPESTDADLTAATQAVEGLNQSIEAQVGLETQDYGYYAQANKSRDELMKLFEKLEIARQVREVRKRTVEAFSAGTAAVNQASSADLRTQKTQYEKAMGLFKACSTDGASMLRENAMLSNAAVVVDGRPSTPKEVVASCVQQVTATDQLLKQVVPLLAFEEGPRRAYELAKSLLDKGKKPEALAQFDECIATGIILQTRSPELKGRKFVVAGAETTLGELIPQCTAQSKALRGK